MHESKRFKIWRATEHWIHSLLAFAKQQSVADRLVIFREINWRLETALVPLLQDWIEPFQEAVNEAFETLKHGKSFQCSVLTINPELSAGDYVDAWFSLAFGLLREARETYDSERWDALKQQIDQIVSLHPAHSDRAAYEDALWAMWNVDHNKAKELLARWQPPLHLPLARMWKAGLLAELDELGEACSILRSALLEIRKALRIHGDNMELLSLEGWYTYLLAPMESAQDYSKDDLIRQEFEGRWQELKNFDCSPWPHREYFGEALARPAPQPHKNEVEVRGFDPGYVSKTYHFANNFREYIPAFAYIRLLEQVGIPLRIRYFDLVGNTLSNACRWIAPFINFLSPALLIRAGKAKEFKESDLLSRISVATMDNALAKRLYEWCLRIFEQQLAKASRTIAMGSVHEKILETLIEALSRLSVRADEELLRKTFPLALQFHNQPPVKTHASLHNAAAPWFQRLFMTASESLLLEWLPQLIRAPLFDERETTIISPNRDWPDPMDRFPSLRLQATAPQYPEFVEKVREATDWLLNRTASESGEGRQRALFRLAYVLDSNLMTLDQEAELGKLLWSDLTDKGLPRLQNFAVASFLHLPVPERIDVKGAVKAHILSLSSQGCVTCEANGTVSITSKWLEHPLIFQSALISKPIVQLGDERRGEVEWSADEAQQLYDKARAWWQNDRKAVEVEKKRGVSFGALGLGPIFNTLGHLGHFFARAILPYVNWTDDSKWTGLLAWMEELRALGAFPTLALPYVMRHQPKHMDAFSNTILTDLDSSEPKAISSAAKAVRHWVHLAKLGSIPEPPPALMRALVYRVIFRRQPEILPCVNELAFLIADLPDSINEAEAKLLERSLVPWESITQFVEHDATGELQPAERPDLRWGLARLAGALGVWFEKNTPEPDGIRVWREACASSPLPEIRRAFDQLKLPS